MLYGYSNLEIIVSLIIFIIIVIILMNISGEKSDPSDPCYGNANATLCNLTPGCVYSGFGPFGSCKSINKEKK